MQYLLENITTTSGITSLRNPSISSEDYTEILGFYKVDYEIIDPYLQVGTISKTQGWILHLSVVIFQIYDILAKLIPLFLKEKVPFKIPTGKESAGNFLNGNYDITRLGKVICVYPEDDNQAISLAKVLIELTKDYKGIDIPTDIYLGGTVYTRYGSFNPIVQEGTDGRKVNYIYDNSGQLVKDPYSIPFSLLQGVNWPFQEITSSTLPIRKRLLNNRYLPLFFMKMDTKGHVLKCLYIKSFFLPSFCVLKQGLKNCLSEDNGRTIHDRLLWQQHLHNDLQGVVRLPKIIDLFIENGDTYLAMELIKGISLFDRIESINFNHVSWQEVPLNQKLEVLEYLIQIISSIERLHQKGYVHRDIAPGNFLITKGGKIVFIDLELSYSIEHGTPNPPFEFGTFGFMSPEQQLGSAPEPSSDIYGIGALFIVALSGLSPVKFAADDVNPLVYNLNFFIENNRMATIIASCLNPDPSLRPKIPEILSGLDNYRNDLRKSTRSKHQSLQSSEVDNSRIRDIIASSIKGLIKDPVVISDGLWYSKYIAKENWGVHTQKEYIKYGGIYQGLSGISYALSRVKRAGFDISACNESYFKSWNYIDSNYLKSLPNIAPGLYGGAAGIALSLCEGIRSGLLEDNENRRNAINKCLNLPNDHLDVAIGVAGQGIAILQCIPFLDTAFAHQRLEQIVTHILDTIEKDPKKFGFGNGIPGIIWFLLEYISKYENKKAEELVQELLDWMLKKTERLNLLLSNRFNKLIHNSGTGDERKAIMLACIKAYEIFNRQEYKEFVEKALMHYPTHITRTDFTQVSGLAGIGELYLEAYGIFRNKEWQLRAEWIVNVFCHTIIRNPDFSGYWKMEERNDPTADLMVGNSGIIHFLARFIHPEKIGYRLLS